MRRKIKCALGDIFEFTVDDEGNKGYGRIMKIDQRLLFIEVYKLVPSAAEYDISHILNATPLFSVWGNDLGLREDAWKIVGNIPIASDYKMPNFGRKTIFPNGYTCCERMAAGLR